MWDPKGSTPARRARSASNTHADVTPHGSLGVVVRRWRGVGLLVALLAAAVGGACSGGHSPDTTSSALECSDTGATELYDRKIAPLFADDQPTSCTECHLAGLDLSLFLRDTPCETMACMIDLGLVDTDEPDDSLVLTWIGRAEPQSELITQDIIDDEYEGFRQWITFNVDCDVCGDAICPDTPNADEFCDRGEYPGDDYDPALLDPGGCDDETIYQLFQDTIYTSRGRCSPCHFDDQEVDYGAPKWIDVLGTCESASRQTLRNVLAGEYIDLEEPDQSLILRKPLPEDKGGVEHGGHDKFSGEPEDLSYRDFVYFVERYAGCYGPASSTDQADAGVDVSVDADAGE